MLILSVGADPDNKLKMVILLSGAIKPFPEDAKQHYVIGITVNLMEMWYLFRHLFDFFVYFILIQCI